jgi:hypothetical protein
MPQGHAFVNVGVWRGFTFLSGMACNEDKICVGIDDFSWFDGPEEECFRREFDARCSEKHSFHAMDYEDYFANVHDQPIGLYCYDGDHSYKNQWRGLEIAEPWFAEGCLVLVDDPNWPQVRRATMEFAAASSRNYRIVMDEGTTDPEHPTFWNGILLLQVGGESSHDGPSQAMDGAAPPSTASDASGAAGKRRREVIGEPLVSLVVHVARDDLGDIAGTIEAALGQTWPAVEVLVADERPPDSAPREVLAQFRDEVEVFNSRGPGRTPSLDAALAAGRGEFVTVVPAGTKLRPRAVHMGLGFPGFRRAVTRVGEDWYEQFDSALAIAEELRVVVPPGSGLILVNEGLPCPRTLNPLHQFPIDGGHPPDDAQAVSDLESLRQSGAAFLGFQRPAFWWLEHYTGLADHLSAAYRRVLENERVILFDLR